MYGDVNRLMPVQDVYVPAFIFQLIANILDAIKMRENPAPIEGLTSVRWSLCNDLAIVAQPQRAVFVLGNLASFHSLGRLKKNEKKFPFSFTI